MPSIDTSSIRIPGDLVAGIALLDVLAEDGNQLAAAVKAHGVVTVEADEPILREQLHNTTLWAEALARGLRHTSHTWNQTAPEAIERREVERLRVPVHRVDHDEQPAERFELRRIPAAPDPDLDRAADLMAVDLMREEIAHGLLKIRRRRRWWMRLLPPRTVDVVVFVGLALVTAAVVTVGLVEVGSWIFEAVIR